MIVDSSAIVAIALHEPERGAFVMAINRADVRRISAGTWVELSAVAVRRRVIALDWLDTLLDEYDMRLEPITIEQARIAHQAYRDYGQGSGSPARLNLGDCFAYALAKAMDEPLLFKGNDFTETDVKRAI